MRKTGYFTKFVLCGIALVGFATMEFDQAYGQNNPLYLGEYCWDDSYGGLTKIGITHMGDLHFSFCGTMQNLGAEWAINGNLEVVGNNLVGTWTDAIRLDGGASFYSRVGDIVLDISTLDGTFQVMEMSWEEGVPSLNHDTASANYVDCGASSSPDGVDKREELIRFLNRNSSTLEENQDRE